MSVQPSPSYDELVVQVAELTALLGQALARIGDLEARLKLSSANPRGKSWRGRCCQRLVAPKPNSRHRWPS
jgi:hypothetical protein